MQKPNTHTHAVATVYRRTIDERSRREFTEAIHRGFIVGETSTHYKVWSNEKNSGDSPDPDAGQLYAKEAKRIWCIVDSTPRTNQTA